MGLFTKDKNGTGYYSEDCRNRRKSKSAEKVF